MEPLGFGVLALENPSVNHLETTSFVGMPSVLDSQFWQHRKKTSWQWANRLIQSSVVGCGTKSPGIKKDSVWTSRCFSLGIQPYSQMIGVFIYLLSIVLGFHYHSQEVIGSLGSVASKRCNFNNESYGILVNHQVRCKRCQVKLPRLSRFVNCMKLLIWPCRFPQLNWEHTHTQTSSSTIFYLFL